ncbi:MAG: 8-oxo-dGTP diphosphatase [Patescibacteria group bacterium]
MKKLFTPLDPENSGFQARGEKSISPKPNKSPILRDGDLTRLTLCVVRTDSRILLGMKKRGFGAGRWNGFGGKVCNGETLGDAARRELEEETGIAAEKIAKQGILRFRFEHSPELLEVHVWSIHRWSGAPRETEEMIPRWFAINEIPYHAMWPGDRYWLPLLLAGKCFTGSFFFRGFDTILEKDIREVVEV